MGKLKALFKKVVDKYNGFGDNTKLHLKTVGLIVGIAVVLWFLIFMLKNFTDLMIVIFILSILGFICWAFYGFVFMMIKTSGKSKNR